jgi:hypothetical protein
MKKANAFFAIVCTVALLSTVCVVYAGTANSASVWTTDILANPKNSFGPAELIYIRWNPAPPLSTVDITVVNVANNVVAGPWLNQPIGNAPIICGPLAPGYYFVLVNGQPAFAIAVASLFVVPESVLGTLMATVAGFAAFGAFRIVKRNRRKGI